MSSSLVLEICTYTNLLYKLKYVISKYALLHSRKYGCYVTELCKFNLVL